MSEAISALHKALDILLLFRDRRLPITIDDMSDQLDIPKSTVYRYVRILTDKGFLERTGKGQYRLGLRFLELSKETLDSNRDLRLTAFPSMKRIAEESGESVSIMRLFSKQAVCIENIEGTHALRVRMEPGRTQFLHAGASSKVLLAHQPEDEWEDRLIFPLKRFTGTTYTNFDELMHHLREIRQQGYAISDGEIDAGARAVAVPIFNSRGDVIAALSIEAPATRMDDDTIARYIHLLQAEALVIRDAHT